MSCQGNASKIPSSLSVLNLQKNITYYSLKLPEKKPKGRTGEKKKGSVRFLSPQGQQASSSAMQLSLQLNHHYHPPVRGGRQCFLSVNAFLPYKVKAELKLNTRFNQLVVIQFHMEPFDSTTSSSRAKNHPKWELNTVLMAIIFSHTSSDIVEYFFRRYLTDFIPFFFF